MKKFLTVLLVIAVMFTFSFSSAFATVADADKLGYDAVEKKINDAYADAVKIVENAKTSALNAMFVGTATTVTDDSGNTIYKAAVEAAYNDVLAAALAAIESQYGEMKNQLARAYALVNASATDAIEFYTVDNTKAYNYTAAADVDTVVIGTQFNYSVDVVGDSALEDISAVSAYEASFKANPVGGADKDAVARYTLEQVLNETRTAIAAIDETAYSAEANSDGTVDRTIVANAKADAQDTLNSIESEVTTSTTYANVFTAVTGLVARVKAVYVPAKGEAPASGTLASAIASLVKTEDAPTHDTVLSFAKSTVIAALTADVNSALNDELKALNNRLVALSLDKKATQADKDAVNKEIETAKANAASAIEIATYLVNDCDDFTKLIDKGSVGTNFAANLSDFDATQAVVDTSNWQYTAAGESGLTGDTIKLCIGASTVTYQMEATADTSDKEVQQITDKVAELKDTAELLKATIKINGGSYAGVDADLEDAIEATYKGDLTQTLSGSTSEKLVLDRIDDLLGVTTNNATGVVTVTEGTNTVKINGVSYTVVTDWALNVFTHSEDNEDAAKAVVKETTDAIKAATTEDDADAAFLAGLEKYKAIKTASDMSVAQATKDFQTAKKAAEADINAYAEYKYNLLNNAGTLKNYTITSANKDAFIVDLKAMLVDETYTAEDVQAALTEAKAAVDNLKTSAEIDAEKKALDERIAALPLTATVADKDVVDAILDDIEDYNDYCDLVQADAKKITVTPYPAKLANAMDAIKTAETKAINDALAAIYKDGKVAADEAEAVDAVAALVDAFVEYYEEAPVYSGKTLAQAEQALWEAEIAAVEAMIAKLPADGSDVAAVKAAKAAFDALERNQKFGVAPAMRDKLDDMVKYTTLDDEAAKAYVQDLSIKARSTKTSKGVKVTIKADVQELLDAGFTVEYKFYRSTKSNKNFGTAKVVKTENTYLNTSGKKGTKYYYKAKLVVKNAAGEVVATTPLTQCLYATRTF